MENKNQTLSAWDAAKEEVTTFGIGVFGAGSNLVLAGAQLWGGHPSIALFSTVFAGFGIAAACRSHASLKGKLQSHAMPAPL